MYLAGYIERLGTGTADIVRIAREAGLKEPEFLQSDDFRVVVYRGQATGQVTMEAAMEATMEVCIEAQKIVLVLEGEMKRSEIQKILQLKNDDYYRLQYINPSIELGLIEMKYPDSPKHPNQMYKLTQKGKELKEELHKSKQ